MTVKQSIKSQPEQLIKKHRQLTHSDQLKVTSHVQRAVDDWVIHTLMIEGLDVPFKFKRKQKYQSLQGQHVNLTYYPASENIAGFELEVMQVVRIKIA